MIVVKIIFFSILLFVLFLKNDQQFRRTKPGRKLFGPDGAYDYEYWLTQAGVPENRIEDCMTWALGSGWPTAPCNMTDDRWNARHSDIFLMRGSDNVIEGFGKMARAYLEIVRIDSDDPKQ